MKNLELLKQLCNADALAGKETEVQKILFDYMSKYADKSYTDNLGSLIFEKKAREGCPKIMFAAHMDEVGFKVKSILKDGHLYVSKIGHIKDEACKHQGVNVTTSKGKKYFGYLNTSKQHNAILQRDIEGAHVDVGANSDKDIEKMGIAVGDVVTYASKFIDQKETGTIIAKAIDDRAGCFVLSQLLENIANEALDCSLYFVATSSEEVGLRGAVTAANKIKPDLAIALDTNNYKDDMVRNYLNHRQIGKGMIITLSESGMETNTKLVDLITKTAEKQGKKYQHDLFIGGGTDAGAIHLCGAGIPTIVCCVPIRYAHTSYSIACTQDIQDTIDIMTAFVKSFTAVQCKDLTSFI